MTTMRGTRATSEEIQEMLDDHQRELQAEARITARAEQPNTAPPASGAGERYNFVVFTGRYKILDYHKPDGQQIATADNEEAARTIVRALNTAEQHSTLIEQREQLIRAMWGLLVEAEVSNVLWQQSRGFVGTVNDAYRKGLMPAAYSRAKQVLTTIEQVGETRG